MKAYQIPELIAAAEASRKTYHEFLRAADLSAGLYRLAAGSSDPQVPHSEDEVYYVLHGSGSIRVADEERAVMPGSVIYVPKDVEHKFHSIVDDMTVLVFFAPAEDSRRTGPVVTG